MKIDRLACTVLVACATALVLLSGCQPAADTTPIDAPPPEPITNATLNLTFEGPPDGFAVATNQGATLEFLPVDSDANGRMWVEAGEPSDFGIDLVSIVNGQKEIYLAEPGGSFSGNRKLITQLGEAYYSRGQFDTDDGRVEEVRVSVLHPTENRLVRMYYRYPDPGEGSAESGQRIPHLLDLVGRILIPVAEVPEGAPEQTADEAESGS
jgi:hypothetical protein